MAFDAVGAVHWDDAGLAEELAMLARRFAAATGLVLGHVGADPTGTVHVTVDGSGRIDGVTVDPGWRTTVDGDGLGAAVAVAVDDALRRHLDAWAAEATRDEEPPQVAVDPWAGLGATADDLGLDARELHYLVIDAADRLREIGEVVERAAVTPSIGSSVRDRGVGRVGAAARQPRTAADPPGHRRTRVSGRRRRARRRPGLTRTAPFGAPVSGVPNEPAGIRDRGRILCSCLRCSAPSIKRGGGAER
jgi:DNA-binding protein YbaB